MEKQFIFSNGNILGFSLYKGNNPYLNIQDNSYYLPLVDYCVMLDYHYLKYRQSNNIEDNWLEINHKHLLQEDSEDYYGDNVCVFFEQKNVKLISYQDYELNKNNFCEISIIDLYKFTNEWKWFVIEWELNYLRNGTNYP